MVLPMPGILNFASKINKTIKMADTKKLQSRASSGNTAIRACFRIFALSMRKNMENSLNSLFNFLFTVKKNKKTPKVQKQTAKISKYLFNEWGKAVKTKC